jgi:hypothetical protein
VLLKPTSADPVANPAHLKKVRRSIINPLNTLDKKGA